LSATIKQAVALVGQVVGNDSVQFACMTHTNKKVKSLNEFKFGLGDEVKDKITGFKGIVRVRSQYLTGCNVYGLQSSKLTKEQKPGEWNYFDEELLLNVKKEKISLHIKAQKGGPNSADQYSPSR
jgi:hypothetical protein